MPHSNYVEIRVGSTHVVDQDIVEATYGAGVGVELSDARAFMGAMRQLLGDKGRAALLVNMSGLMGQSAEARAYYAESDEAPSVATKVALLVDSLVTRVFANSLMTIKKPNIPTRVFTDRDQAIAWLKEPVG